MNPFREYKILTFVLFIMGAIQTKAQDFVDQAEMLGLNIVVSGDIYGSGLSTYDFNRDGLDDISLASSTGELKFYINTGNGFELQSFAILSAGLTAHLIWVDVDNDGRLDIYFTTTEGRQFLYINQGNFEFEDATESSGLPIYDAHYYGASFADYDLDGDLDLYTCKYYLNEPNSYDISKYNKLFQNQGDGTFIDVTMESGIFKNPTSSFQSTWLDYDNDGWPDLHVINDRFPVNFFFHNNGDGTFTEIAGELGITFPNNDVMSNSVADFDHDGDLDIFMTNTGNITYNAHNLLIVNGGFQGFIERSVQLGLDTYVHGWGAVWIDADNDSWQDLVFATNLSNPIYYFKNQEGVFFTEHNNLIIVDQHATTFCPSRGDFNNDGYADIAIQSTGPHRPYVLINQGGENNYIKVTPKGTISNKQAIGSWVQVFVNGSVYTEYTHCGENYLGQNSQHLIFGLGPNIATVDSIKVKYPSRHIDTYYDVPSDSAYYFTEGETYICEITSANQKFNFCEGDSILIDAGLHSHYLWNTGDTTRTIWVNTTSEYIVTTQNQFGILATDTVTISENPNPIISALLTHPLCHGDSTGSIELINLSQTPIDSVEWSHGDYGNFIDSLPAGAYDYILFDENGCSTANSHSILEPSAMQFYATSTPEMDQNQNGSISINVFGGSAPYQIYLDTMLVGTQIDSLANGAYTFTIIDSNLCSDTVTIVVDFVTNTNSYDEIQVDLLPNPVSNDLTIRSDQLIETVSILNITGQVVMQFSQAYNNQYSLTNLPIGTYIIRISFENKGVAVYRIVKI